jgi:hypothetical protein
MSLGWLVTWDGRETISSVLLILDTKFDFVRNALGLDFSRLLVENLIFRKGSGEGISQHGS